MLTKEPLTLDSYQYTHYITICERGTAMPGIMVYVPDSLLAQVRVAAAERKVKLSQVIQAALKIWLEGGTWMEPPPPVKPTGDSIAQFMTEANRLRATAATNGEEK